MSFLSACESINSADIRTSGIYARFKVTPGMSVSKVEADLRAGGPSSNVYVDMADGDYLYANSSVDSSTQQFSKIVHGEIVKYEAQVTATSGDTIYVGFHREQDDSAPDNSVVLPQSFTISEPAADTRISRSGGTIALNWGSTGNAADTMSISFISTCQDNLALGHIRTLGGEASSYSFNAADYFSELPSGDCAVKLILNRKRFGVVDQAFEGGVITAEVEKTLRLIITD